MEFVGSYAFRGLSPQDTGMPAILHKSPNIDVWALLVKYEDCCYISTTVQPEGMPLSPIGQSTPASFVKVPEE